MYAISCPQPGGPEALKLVEEPDPRPGDSEIVIDVVAAGVNRADLMQREGHYPPPSGASETIGLEVSGRIRSFGAGVTGWREGDPCVALLAGGGYAEQVLVPAGQVIRPPDGVDLVRAAGLVEVAATVVSNFDAAGLGDGDTVLVHGGSGGIGSFAIPYAKALGARVITTAGSEDKLEFCRSIGADVALSYRDDWAAGVAEATGGKGVDVILDVMGGGYLEPNVTALATNGRLMIIGMQGGRKGTLDLGVLMPKRASVHAMTLRARPPAEKAAICERVSTEVWPLVTSGAIPLAPTRTFPLAEAAQAHARLESGDSHGKIVITTDLSSHQPTAQG